MALRNKYPGPEGQPSTTASQYAAGTPNSAMSNASFGAAIDAVIQRLLTGSGLDLGGGGGSGRSSATARRKKQNDAIMNIFKRRQGEATKYYAGQEKQATGNINKALQDFLGALGGPTAYQNAPVPNLPQTQMGLLAQLQQYGATPELAQTQQNTDAAYAQQMQDIFNRSNQQMQSTDQAYYNSLQAGAQGGQAQALMALANLMAGLRSQTQGETAGARDEMLLRALGL